MSIIYLQDGCSPCYFKFKEYHDQLLSFNYTDNHGILFVIKGHDFHEFLAKVPKIDSLGNYYIFIDKHYDYLANNKIIPRWIIDSAVLIDSNNRIKMVGVPWINPEMMELFYTILK